MRSKNFSFPGRVASHGINSILVHLGNSCDIFIMIAVIYILLSCLWWFLSLTVGLPLTLALLFSLSFRSLFFAWANSNIFEPFASAGFDVARKKAFRMLQDELNPGSELLEVLEIGVGHGPNLRFYKENYNLTALDKNENMRPYFLKNLKRFPHIPYRGFVMQPAENMKDIPDASFDVVVSTYLHCSTHDSDAVLREIKRVLKPGGKYVFTDHVGFPKDDIGLYIQKFMNPLWYLHGNGCNMHRDTASKIKAAGFTEVICDQLVFKELRMYFIRHQIAGIAIK